MPARLRLLHSKLSGHGTRRSLVSVYYCQKRRTVLTKYSYKVDIQALVSQNAISSIGVVSERFLFFNDNSMKADMSGNAVSCGSWRGNTKSGDQCNTTVSTQGKMLQNWFRTVTARVLYWILSVTERKLSNVAFASVTITPRQIVCWPMIVEDYSF